MANFIIQEVSTNNNYMTTSKYGSSSVHYGAAPQIEVTLRLIDPDPYTMKNLKELIEQQKPVDLVDTDFDKSMKKFSKEFEEFMMERHPDKLIKNSKSWSKLKGL